MSGLSMVSHAVNWRCACHCMVFVERKRGEDAEVQIEARVTSCVRVKAQSQIRKTGSVTVNG